MKVLITGDFCPIGRTDQFLQSQNYDKLFNGFEKIIAKVDYSIVNFECPVTHSEVKIIKTGPCLKTENMNVFDALKFAGFNLFTLANNHIQDYSGQGVLDTISFAEKNGFETVGAGRNKVEAAKPFIALIKGKKVGFINIGENEFCAATNEMPGANTFDLIENVKVIQDLKKHVDKIILIYHGGREHYQLPTPEQRKRFRFFIDCGVDAIVAHHTHCFSGYEFYNNKPIVYSLGNFIFDYKVKYQQGLWTKGMSVILTLEGDDFKIELVPHFQGRREDSTLRLLCGEEKRKFLDDVEELTKIINNDNLFFTNWDKYLKSQEAFYLSSLYVKNLYLRALFMKGILPISFLKTKHRKLALNLIRCETHHEITKGILEN